MSTARRIFSSHDLPNVGQRIRTIFELNYEGTVIPVGSYADVTDIQSEPKSTTLGVDVYVQHSTLSVPTGVWGPTCFEWVRGRPFVAGDDVRRRSGTNPSSATKPSAPSSSDAELAQELAESVSRAVTAALTARPSAAAVDLEPLTARVDGLTAGHETLTDRLASFAEATRTGLQGLIHSYGAVDARVTALHEALAAAPPATIARAAITARIATGKEPLLAAILPWYVAGTDTAANVMLCSPPSLGKSYAVRTLGESYDLYREHGAADDPDEIITLLGGPTPDNEHGGFANPDGVLVEVVRAAAAGKTVLFLIDEVLRFSPRAQEWLLTFLTGVKTPAGRVYRLRTRKLKDGSFEHIECPTRNLHIIAATNLGVIAPVEAFWSRWHKVRVPFSREIVREVSSAVCASYGITDYEKLVEGFTTVVTESRLQVAAGTLRFPADIRLLETSCRAAAEPTGSSVAAVLAAALPDQTAHWNIDTGDTLPESTAVCEAWVALLKTI